MQVQIVTRYGIILNFAPPANFNFQAWCMAVKAQGGVWTENIHVPYDSINFLAMGDVQFGATPTVPGPETRQ